jgi:hypothetical protein
MEVRQSPFGTLSAANLDQSVKLEITKVVTPRAELEKLVALYKDSAKTRAEADAFMASTGLVASGPSPSPDQWTPMSMEKYLLTFADRMEGAAKREGNGGLLKTAEGLREQAAEVAAHGTTVDPLMVLILQQKLFQKGGTYGPPGYQTEGGVLARVEERAQEAVENAVEPQEAAESFSAAIVLSNFEVSKLSELEPWLDNRN